MFNKINTLYPVQFRSSAVPVPRLSLAEPEGPYSVNYRPSVPHSGSGEKFFLSTEGAA